MITYQLGEHVVCIKARLVGLDQPQCVCVAFPELRSIGTIVIGPLIAGLRNYHYVLKGEACKQLVLAF